MLACRQPTMSDRSHGASDRSRLSALDRAAAADRRGDQRPAAAPGSSRASASAPSAVIACAPVLVAFVLARAWPSCSCSGCAPEQRFLLDQLLPGSTSARLHVDIAFWLDPLSAVMILVVTGVGGLIHIYSIGYMHDEQGVLALLRLPEPVHLRDADAGARRQPAADVRRLGGRRPVLLRADRLLVQGPGQRHAPATRRSSSTASATSASCSALFLLFWALDRGRASRTLIFREIAQLRPRCSQGQIFWGFAGADVRHAAALRRRHRQVGADSAVRLAARRHGRPDAGQRADPRRHDGHRRRLHDRAGSNFLFTMAPDDARRGRRRSAR